MLSLYGVIVTSYVLSKDFREYYVGELQNNLMHGFGVMLLIKWKSRERRMFYE